MTAAERLVLVAIAEKTRTKAREVVGIDVATLSRRTGGLDPSNIRAALRRLASRGIEVRVEVGRDRRGRPVYAHRGQAPRYRLPSFPVPPGCRCSSCPEGGRERPPSGESPGRQGGRERPPYPEGGRSTTEGGRRTTDNVVERPPSPSETDPVIDQRPATVAYLSSRTGATDEMSTLLIKTIKTRFHPRSIGAYVRAMSDADLAELLAELNPVPAGASLPPSCGECGPGRLRELPDGTPFRCPECHPGALSLVSSAGAPRNPGGEPHVW